MTVMSTQAEITATPAAQKLIATHGRSLYLRTLAAAYPLAWRYAYAVAAEHGESAQQAALDAYQRKVATLPFDPIP